jgi:PAS domain S-box-containing protein
LRELPKVYFERLVESSPDIIVAVDRNGIVIFYNDGAKRTLGYKPEEVLGKSVDIFYPSHAEAQRIMSAMRSEAHGGVGRVKNFETTFVDAQGNHVPVAISGSIIYDERGDERGSIGFAKDITELRVHEKMQTLGQLAVGLAHEINNPLEALVNHLQMLERYLREKASHEDYRREHDRIDSMKRELRRIQSIVERVGEIADSGDYGTIEYLPGRLMTDLGVPKAAVAPAATVEAKRAANGHLRGKTILVVDDDADVCASMADILNSEGCTIITTGSGLEALRCIEQCPVDMVLSDVVMPDMDGYDLFQEIHTKRPDLPVVLMTAYYYDKDHVIKRSKANGLIDVIFKKPIDPSRLIELIGSRVGT